MDTAYNSADVIIAIVDRRGLKADVHFGGAVHNGTGGISICARRTAQLGNDAANQREAVVLRRAQAAGDVAVGDGARTAVGQNGAAVHAAVHRQVLDHAAGVDFAEDAVIGKAGLNLVSSAVKGAGVARLVKGTF